MGVTPQDSIEPGHTTRKANHFAIKTPATLLPEIVTIFLWTCYTQAVQEAGRTLGYHAR